MKCKDMKIIKKKQDSLKEKIYKLEQKIADVMSREGYVNDAERDMYFGIIDKVVEYKLMVKGE